MRLHHLGVWSYLSHKDTSTSIQTVAARFISRYCTFAWRHQPFPSHRGGNWRCQASPHSYWPPLRCTNIDDDVTHSSAGPVYIQDSTFAITLATDVLAPHGARSLVETRMTIPPYTFYSYFNWQSMIMFNFNWPEKVTQMLSPAKYTCPWIPMRMINYSHNIRHKCLNRWLEWYSIYSGFVHDTVDAWNRHCTVKLLSAYPILSTLL